MRALARAATRPGLLLAGAAAGALVLAFLPGEAGPLAARAALGALAAGAVAALAARRPGARAAPPLRVAARAALGRAATVALVEVDGRRFLVGAGERSLELLAELEPATPGEAP